MDSTATNITAAVAASRYDMRHLDLFSGIGGFALATEMIWQNVEHIFVEYDPFCQAVLRKHWPIAEIHGDIKEYRGGCGPVDLITGGFPCQPFSTAGKRRGTEDDRHLWPEMLRVICTVRPTWIIGENVGGILTWDDGMVLESVLSDLESAHYEAWPFVIPAAAIDAPHRRDRVWIVAHAIGSDARRDARTDARSSATKGLRQWDTLEQSSVSNKIRLSSDTSSSGRGERDAQRSGILEGESTLGTKERGRFTYSDRNDPWKEDWPEAITRLCSLDDGLPGGLVRPRGWRNATLKAAGNAIVPQVAAEIMRAMQMADTI